MSNKLINEESPYLQQHAQNPVEWYPWSQEPFNLAKKENKPIFLSIGYSSCHWCHVMQKESFENEEIAKELNENFISIKVDKEERPDIDKHFQNIYMQMNGRGGGWPLSIFMSPNKEPIYSATYIPPIANYGKMGFKDLIKVISNSWRQDSKTLIQKGQDVISKLLPSNKIEATKIDNSLQENIVYQLKQVYDKKYGGFGNAPKFPHASTLDLALDLYKITQDSQIKDIITHTLNVMSLGGIYDIVEGGFCRYSTDEMWLVPHFEKMLYDNALMIQVYVKAYRVLGIESYKNIALEIANFVINKMSSDNLYYSASDADSNGIEGNYFIYNYEEVKSEFEKNGVDTKMLFELSITRNGNFDAKSIARFNSLESKNMPEVNRALEVLKDIRARREYPFIDKKIITSWNAMMVTALFKLSKIDDRFLDIAINSLDALKSKMSSNLNIYHTSMVDTLPKEQGFLEDYAYFIEMLLEAFNQTLDELYLIEATNLANEAIRRFYKGGRWQISNGEFIDYADDFDSSYPSEVSKMVQNLLVINSLVEPVYEKFIFTTLQVSSYNLMRQPISRPAMTKAALIYLRSYKIVKADIDKLKEIAKKDYKEPFILLKPVNSDFIEICNSSACFAKIESVDEVDSYFNS